MLKRCFVLSGWATLGAVVSAVLAIATCSATAGHGFDLAAGFQFVSTFGYGTPLSFELDAVWRFVFIAPLLVLLVAWPVFLVSGILLLLRLALHPPAKS